MKRKILTMLRQNNEYISGQQICEELGVSRTAVWKAVNGLKNDGYVIEAVQNKGYHLLEAPDVLTEAEIGSLRTDKWKDAPIYAYAETDSTNIQAAHFAEDGAPEGTLVVADVQKSGKGRRGRKWETPSGVSIAMSFVLRPAFGPDKASMLTLLAALAGCRAVQELTGECPMIKWPNDLVLNRKKICGILTEMAFEEDYIRQVVVGIGFNVGQEQFPEELKDKATSLYLETGKHFSRAKLVSLVMKYFIDYYEEFIEKESLASVMDEYNKNLINRDEEVRILRSRGEWKGVSLGIDESGALLVKDEEGNVRSVVAGEVSVRGLYQYT